jgi:TnpA family transposase
MRDRSFESQRYRAGGLTLLTAAIILWNTVYLERAVQALRNHSYPVDDSCCSIFHPWVGNISI